MPSQRRRVIIPCFQRLPCIVGHLEQSVAPKYQYEKGEKLLLLAFRLMHRIRLHSWTISNGLPNDSFHCFIIADNMHINEEK